MTINTININDLDVKKIAYYQALRPITSKGIAYYSLLSDLKFTHVFYNSGLFFVEFNDMVTSFGLEIRESNEFKNDKICILNCTIADKNIADKNIRKKLDDLKKSLINIAYDNKWIKDKKKKKESTSKANLINLISKFYKHNYYDAYDNHDDDLKCYPYMKFKCNKNTIIKDIKKNTIQRGIDSLSDIPTKSKINIIAQPMLYGNVTLSFCWKITEIQLISQVDKIEM
jgi:hypothetical protein